MRAVPHQETKSKQFEREQDNYSPHLTAIQCTAERPRCATCLRAGVDCVYRSPQAKALAMANQQQLERLQQNYTDLQTSHATLDVIIRAIQSQDQERAGSIVQMLRDGITPDDIVRQITAGDAMVEMRLATETKFRFEFPYRAQMPREVLSSNSPYLRSPIYELYQAPEQAALLDQHNPQFMKPYHAADILDPRLKSVVPSQWTVVSKDDALMRDLLRHYFLHEYPWYAFFHMDHFLDDMLHGVEDYCSALLVNTILTLACVCSSCHTSSATHGSPANYTQWSLATGMPPTTEASRRILESREPRIQVPSRGQTALGPGAASTPETYYHPKRFALQYHLQHAVHGQARYDVYIAINLHGAGFGAVYYLAHIMLREKQGLIWVHCVGLV